MFKRFIFFQCLSKRIIYVFKNTRSVILALVLSTFMCDLFLANDMSLITLLPLIFVKKEPLKLIYNENHEINKKRVMVYLEMFIFSLLTIFRVVPNVIGVIVITLLAIIFDKKALKTMDWDLLLTFCCFFVFSGNISRITVISNFLINMLSKSVLITGLISCQFISKVPTAVLLANFTDDYKSLITSVNIGSLGTLISSFASLITLKIYLKTEPNGLGKYILMFTGINLCFLVILLSYTLIFS